MIHFQLFQLALRLIIDNKAGGRPLCENLDQGREYRLNTVRSVHMTEVKILPDRPTKFK